jgi:hypothetical protein
VSEPAAVGAAVHLLALLESGEAGGAALGSVFEETIALEDAAALRGARISLFAIV